MSLFNFIKNELPILDVISEYVPIKPAGHYWKASCPFHSETDASFTVSPDKQIFYCFGCHTHGDSIAFIAKKENLTQLEAAKLLIERYHLNVPEQLANQFSQVIASSQAKESYFKTCKAFATWAHNAHFHNRIACDYLAARNLSAATIKQFQVGYLPGGNLAIKQLIKDLAAQNILVQDLLDAGILMESKAMLYSPFEERIIFPISDTSGRCCGFGGRIFRPGDERPKYYNSRENEGFAKGKLLFGLDLAKKAIQDQQIAFLVEGYMDCITMAQYGYTNTIATLGTACTVEHLKLIARFAPQVYILYDGDQAGQKAIIRLAELCWEVNLEPLAITLPPGEDPASILSKGDKLDLVISQAQDIFSFFIKSLGINFFTKPLAHKLALMEKMLNLIVKISDPIKQELLLQQASSTTNISFASLQEGLKRLSTKLANRAHYNNQEADYSADLSEEENTATNESSDISLLEEKIISVILTTNLHANNKKLEIEPELVSYFSQNVQEILSKIKAFNTKAHAQSNQFGMFLETLSETEKAWVIKASLLFDEDVSVETFNQLIFRFCKYNWKQIVRDIKTHMLIATEEKNTDRLNELFHLFSKLKQGIQSRGLI